MTNPKQEVYDMDRDYDVVLELAEDLSDEAREDVFGRVGGEPPHLDDAWPYIRASLDELSGEVTGDEVAEAVRYGWRQYNQDVLDEAGLDS